MNFYEDDDDLRPSCAHCWVWDKRFVNYTTDEGELLKGTYVLKRCWHCHKSGPAIYPYTSEDEPRLLQSQQTCAKVHYEKRCPSEKLREKALAKFRKKKKKKKKVASYDDF